MTHNGYIKSEENSEVTKNKKYSIGSACGSSDKHIPSKKEKHRKRQENNVSSSKKPDKSLSESFCTKYSSCRWQLAYMCFLARFIQTTLRQSMGVAIIGMTLKRKVENTPYFRNVTNNSSEITEQKMIQEFEWSSAFEGVILASFNMGSIVTPIIVGYLATRFGGRKLMSLCLLAGGMFTVLLPIAAKADITLIVVFRIFTGISLSGTDSLIQAMWARWAPLYEKASLSAFAYTGLSTAGVLTFLVCGYIVSIDGEGTGWPYIFYIFGSTCLLLAPLWYFTVYDSPKSHPTITKKELNIIAFNNRLEKSDYYRKALKTPWRRIFKSTAVWAIVMGHITHKWVLACMLAYLPRFFSDMFHFDLKTDGLFSSLPFAGRVISGVIAGHVSDWMLRKGVSTERTRKFFQATGCWGCAACSLLIVFIPSMSSAWSISLLVLALSCQDLTSVAFRINLLDIAPRYAGLLNGVVSTIATLTSLAAPVLTSLLIAGGSRQGWQILFCLVAALNIFGGITFVIFAKGELQDWAQDPLLNNHTIRTDDGVAVFTLETNKEIKSVDATVHRKALRKVNSLPISTRRCRCHQWRNVGRRATFDVGSLIKGVQGDGKFEGDLTGSYVDGSESPNQPQQDSEGENIV